MHLTERVLRHGLSGGGETVVCSMLLVALVRLGLPLGPTGASTATFWLWVFNVQPWPNRGLV